MLKYVYNIYCILYHNLGFFLFYFKDFVHKSEENFILLIPVTSINNCMYYTHRINE